MRSLSAAIVAGFILCVSTTAMAADGGSTTVPSDGGKVRELDAGSEAGTATDSGGDDDGGCAVAIAGKNDGFVGMLIVGAVAAIGLGRRRRQR